MVRGFNSECVPKHVPSTCEQAHRSLGRAPPHRPLMNSHAHVILEREEREKREREREREEKRERGERGETEGERDLKI